MSTLSSSREESQRTVEVQQNADPRSIRRVRGRPLTHYWPWIQHQARSLLLSPCERVTDRSVSWIWDEPGEAANLSAEELSHLRKRLRRMESEFTELAESNEGNAANEALLEVQCAMSAVAASLAEKSDRQLAAYAARTTGGVMIHSWGSLKAADPRGVREKTSPATDIVPAVGDLRVSDQPALNARANEVPDWGADQPCQGGAMQSGRRGRGWVRKRWLWGVGLGVAMLTLMIPGVRYHGVPRPGAVLERPVPETSDALPGESTRIVPSGRARIAADRDESGDGLGGSAAKPPSSSTPGYFGGDLELEATGSLNAPASPAALRERAMVFSSSESPVTVQGEIAAERPLVFSPNNSTVPVLGGAAMSDAPGLSIDAGLGAGSASRIRADRTLGKHSIEPSDNVKANDGFTSGQADFHSDAGVGRSSVGRSLSLPENPRASHTGPDTPEANQRSPDAAPVKTKRTRVSISDREAAASAGPGEVSEEGESASVGTASRAAADAASSGSVRHGAFGAGLRTMKMGISPWTFELVRDAVISTRPVPLGSTDDSESIRRVVLQERLAHAPRALRDAKFSWGLAVEQTDASFAFESRRAQGGDGLIVWREGKRVLLRFPDGPTQKVEQIEWGSDSGSVRAMTIGVGASGEITVALGDGLRASVWISTQLESPGDLPVEPDSAELQTRLEWMQLPAPASVGDRIVGRIAPHPWLEISLEEMRGTQIPLVVSLMDQDSGWAWTSQLSIR